MKYKGTLNASKSIFAIFLCMGIVVANVSGQQETKPQFNLKDRFISSGGLFYGEPINAGIKNNYLGLSFSPQLNLLNSYSDFSIAFGTQLDMGYMLSSNESDSKLMTSIPALITLNAGHLASHDFFSRFGIFAGGGYDFCFLNGEMSKGVMWSAGLRTWFLKKSFTLRYSQLLLNGSNTMNIFSLQLNLGSYIKQVYKNNQISHFVNPMRH